MPMCRLSFFGWFWRQNGLGRHAGAEGSGIPKPSQKIGLLGGPFGQPLLFSVVYVAWLPWQPTWLLHDNLPLVLYMLVVHVEFQGNPVGADPCLVNVVPCPNIFSVLSITYVSCEWEQDYWFQTIKLWIDRSQKIDISRSFIKYINKIFQSFIIKIILEDY